MSDFKSAPHVVTFLAVSEWCDEIEAEGFDVHTITMVLNGQHGQFDLTIQASDEDCQNTEWTGIAHIAGGIDKVSFANEVVA